MNMKHFAPSVSRRAFAAGLALAPFALTDTPRYVAVQPANPAVAPAGNWTMARAINDAGQIVVDGTTAAILTLNGEVVDLGSRLWPVAINNHGHVVGDFPGGGLLWEHGQVTELPMDTTDINDVGQVCGYDNSGPAVVWVNGEITELPFGHEDLASVALAINNAGQVVGWSGVEWGQHHPVLWDEGELIELPPPPGAGIATPVAGSELSSAAATAISEAGHIVGMWDELPVLWREGEAMVLPMPPGTSFGGPLARLYGVNSRGQIAGTCEKIHARAVLWEDGEPILLPMLPGDMTSEARGINEAGQVVGVSGDGNGSRAVLWQDGEVIDLDGIWRGA